MHHLDFGGLRLELLGQLLDHVFELLNKHVPRFDLFLHLLSLQLERLASNLNRLNQVLISISFLRQIIVHIVQFLLQVLILARLRFELGFKVSDDSLLLVTTLVVGPTRLCHGVLLSLELLLVILGLLLALKR